MSKKLSIDYIKEYLRDKYGVVVLSKQYKNNSTPIKIKDKNSQVFYKSWSSIRKSGTCCPNVKISSYREAKDFIESYKGLGYTYKLTFDEYTNQEVKKGNRVYAITHPKLTGTWYTNLTDFRRDAETHLNTSGRSYGELVIKSILVENNIEFSEQVTINIEGQTHRFDFYIESFNLFIEYDGEQHYNKSTGFYRDKTSKIKQRDEVKNTYVKDLGSRLLRIPYTYDTVDSIADLMGSEIDVRLKRPSEVYSLNDKEIADTYVNHNLREASDLLGINSTTVTRAFKKVHGTTKREYLKNMV